MWFKNSISNHSENLKFSSSSHWVRSERVKNGKKATTKLLLSAEKDLINHFTIFSIERITKRKLFLPRWHVFQLEVDLGETRRGYLAWKISIESNDMRVFEAWREKEEKSFIVTCRMWRTKNQWNVNKFFWLSLSPTLPLFHSLTERCWWARDENWKSFGAAQKKSTRTSFWMWRRKPFFTRELFQMKLMTLLSFIELHIIKRYTTIEGKFPFLVIPLSVNYCFQFNWITF